MDWIQARLDDLANLGSGGWLAIAAWAALTLGVIALLYINRQVKKNRQLRADQVRPQVTMFMEPHAADWHVIELVVKNFGSTAAYDIKLDFINHPTVAAYEDSDYDGPPDVAELDLPSELTFLAPGQEWRTVWDSAISREELGGNIRSRFDGTLTYFDKPRPDRDPGMAKMWNKRQEFETKVTLDWATLQPVQRLELMTSHDLAKREKQKLELLRTVLTYYHFAIKDSRPEVYRTEIDRMNRAIKECQDRWRTTQFDQTTELEFPWIKNGVAAEPARSGASGRHRDPA
ncbi:hypothetical protein [Mycolicibacterium arenosum]|uniref:Uncharacterized protein n=1 Tax=Mycolicibacterium arenosum TaxID=2952157 RepID=A0ABT1M812_9MYCO|nr:hypothetical protein [Mycolicibacterium sp. CAU 1645]MCP9275263.1 hypothetical protein [Mycolicibacterium sp. CAU 1645]